MTDTTSLKIDEIIKKRQPLVKTIDSVSNNMDKLNEALLNYQNSSNVPDNALQEVLLEVNQSQNELIKLKHRFNRNTLNIGIIGRMRQGKSQLLQSISGLGDCSIPTSSRMATTGACSMIQNYPDGQTYAEVCFYTEQEFMQEVIHPYFNELKLDIKPQSLAEFSTITIPDNLSESVSQSNKIDRLKQYHQNIPNYRERLRSQGALRITETEIPQFVAQFNPNNPEEKYTDYMAVRQVKIHAPFPNTSVRNIALIDMPGLGEITVGDDQRMIKALNEEVDIVLFMRMPKATGDDWQQEDINLYDTAAQSLNAIAIKDWSFQVLNVLDDDSNRKNCEDFKGDMSKRGIQVAHTQIANASNPDAVHEKILNPLLDHMAEHVTALDQQYVSSIQQKLDALSNRVLEIMGNSGSDANADRIFSTLFRSSIKQISTNLKQLVKDLKKTRDQEDTNLLNSLEKSVEKTKKDKKLPNHNEIEHIASIDYMSGAFNHFKDAIRNDLVQQFMRLDEGVQQSVKETKHKVCQVLIDSGFGFISNNSESFLHDFVKIINNDPHFATLNGAFQVLGNFQLSYRGLIQHRIRKHLDVLHGDSKEFELPDNPEPEDIIERLDVAYDKVVYDIENEVRQLLWEPSMACFAIIEEFADRVIHSENVRDQEWRDFMNEHRIQLWPEQFGDIALREAVKSLVGKPKLQLVA